MRMLLAALVVLLHSTQAFRELHSTAVQRFEEGPDETKEPDQGEEEPNQEAQVKELAPSEEEDDEEEADQQEGQVGEDAGPGEQQDAEPVEEQDVEDLPAPVAAQKVRAKDMAEGDEGDPEELLNLEEFLPLCDKEIVEDTCRLLNEGEKHEEVEKYTTWQEIEQHLSADEKSLDRFRQITGIAVRDGKVWVECEVLCKKLVSLVTKSTGAILPHKSDLACYHLDGESFCDVDVRPSKLRSLGPKQHEDLPDFDDQRFLGQRGIKAKGILVEEHSRPLEELESDTPEAAGVRYSFWEGVERLANLFRFYPAPPPPRAEGPFGPISLLQTGGMTRTEARKNKQKQEEAKAYMGIVIRAFSARQTETHMRRWFGSDAFQTASIRREVVRVLNSVDHMISNVHFVYPGAMCEERTYAYVYPRGGACELHEMEEYACRTKRDTNEFVFYLCPLYFKRPQEMVKTLVHEGSHHATAYTDDVKFQGETAYGRRTCQKLAKRQPLQALKNADNFCYYIQDAAEEVSDHPAEVHKSEHCPSFAKYSQVDNDGDCRCRKGAECHFGGSLGCPFSATSRRQIYSETYFNQGCAGCTCQDSRTSSRRAGSRSRKTERCPDFAALSSPDSDGDCYCAGGLQCTMQGAKGCTFSLTASTQRTSHLYFSASCSECLCEAP